LKILIIIIKINKNDEKYFNSGMYDVYTELHIKVRLCKEYNNKPSIRYFIGRNGKYI
jgi:hypothetical protein